MIFLFLTNIPVYSESNSGTYDDITFPQWAKDLRRTEIITFGSLPFVTLWTTMLYSLAVKGTFTNPFDKSTSSFSEADQWTIIKISAATCVGLGLTDLVISLIRRNAMEKQALKNKKTDAFTITPYSQMEKNFPFEELPPPDDNEEKNGADQTALPEYFFEGMMDAIF